VPSRENFPGRHREILLEGSYLGEGESRPVFGRLTSELVDSVEPLRAGAVLVVPRVR
jgi:hypothetical protein